MVIFVERMAGQPTTSIFGDCDMAALLLMVRFTITKGMIFPCHETS
jgi:hypothetical protein